MTNKRFAMRRGGEGEGAGRAAMTGTKRRPRTAATETKRGGSAVVNTSDMNQAKKKDSPGCGAVFFLLGERATGLIILLRCGSGFVG